MKKIVVILMVVCFSLAFIAVTPKPAFAYMDTTEARAQRARENWKKNRESYQSISKGFNNPRAILTEEQVKEIKTLLPFKKVRELSDLFGVRLHVIQQIKSGKNWKHV